MAKAAKKAKRKKYVGTTWAVLSHQDGGQETAEFYLSRFEARAWARVINVNIMTTKARVARVQIKEL